MDVKQNVSQSKISSVTISVYVNLCICFVSKVPGLYNTEELEPIISLLKDVAAQEGFVGSPTSYFFKCKVINRGCRTSRILFPKCC